MSEFGFEKEPLPVVVQVELVAVPPIVPCKLTTEPLQIEVSFPASAIGCGLKVMILTSETEGQGLMVPVALSVRTIFPVAPIDGI